jgi:hypothetical protein
MPPKSPLHRAAALYRVAMVGGAAVSAPARAARLNGYLDRVDPDRQLPEDERAARAHALLRADMTKLAVRSAQSRRRRADAAELRGLAAELDAAADELEATS